MNSTENANLNHVHVTETSPTVPLIINEKVTIFQSTLHDIAIKNLHTIKHQVTYQKVFFLPCP